MHERNVYRGHVVSLAQEPYGSMRVKFHALPTIAREDIVLADGVLEQVERHTVGFATHRDRLLRPDATCAAACCSTANPAPARPSRRCIWPAGWGSARWCC